ncbi:MAG: hypothetical protein HY741_29345 [Chloroflexi bacterium]|nr:hypothetical protein [Chloroflexota bacterium]
MNRDELKRELTNVVYMASGIRTGAIQAFEQKDYAGAMGNAAEGIRLLESTVAKYPEMDEIFAPYLFTFYAVRASSHYEMGRATKNADLIRRALQDIGKASSDPPSAATHEQRSAVQQLQRDILQALKRFR